MSLLGIVAKITSALKGEQVSQLGVHLILLAIS